MLSIVVAVDSDGSVTWEETLTPLAPMTPTERGAALFRIAAEQETPAIDIDKAVPIYVVKPSDFDANAPTLAGRKRAA